MSVQTYINKLSDAILYRLNHLDRFTDHIFINIDSISSHPNGDDRFVFYEDKVDAYELCDILHSIKQDHDYYSWTTMLLLSCPEHEPTRELKPVIIPAPLG